MTPFGAKSSAWRTRQQSAIRGAIRASVAQATATTTKQAERVSWWARGERDGRPETDQEWRARVSKKANSAVISADKQEGMN